MTSTQSDPFSVPREDRYFEDYIPGLVCEYGSVSLSEQEIIEFAAQYDPQSFHTDPVAAEQGPFGGLAASGWHTLSVMSRLLVDHYVSTVASLGSPGIDELRWLQPVRPHDVLRVRATVVDARRSSSKPDRGIVRTNAELFNQDDEPVLRYTVLNFMRVRHTQ